MMLLFNVILCVIFPTNLLYKCTLVCVMLGAPQAIILRGS